jgi:hypothetical protein
MFPVMALRAALKRFLEQKPQLVLTFAGVLTLAWVALLIWVSAGLIDLI